MRFQGQTEYNHKESPLPQGILLTNLGTPDHPTSHSVRVFLREFLSDPRVVEIPRAVWMIILYLFILPLRPSRSAKLFQQVWTEDGSPLMDITRRQAVALQDKIDEHYGEGRVIVEMGMRYGNPSIKCALDKLAAANARNITVLPLYPQYSAVTTGSTFDAVADVLSKYRWVPQLQFINDYHQHPAYLDALSKSVAKHIEEKGMPDKIVMSYHGVPERYLHQGDPYYCFCMQTTRLVREQLGLAEESVITTFQSRFGKATWLQPYTDKTLEKLPDENIKSIAVICPGFSADCLETIEEIGVENRDIFMAAGGVDFHYIDCLNDQPDHIEMMLELLKPRLAIDTLEPLGSSHGPEGQ